MSKPVTVITIVAVASLAFFAARRLQADETDKHDLTFKGKVALIYLKGRSAEYGFTLEDAKIIDFHGKPMLSAKHAETGPDENWIANRPVFLDWTSVESITLFDSLEEYKEAIDEADDSL